MIFPQGLKTLLTTSTLLVQPSPAANVIVQPAVPALAIVQQPALAASSTIVQLAAKLQLQLAICQPCRSTSVSLFVLCVLPLLFLVLFFVLVFCSERDPSSSPTTKACPAGRTLLCNISVI